MTQQPDQVRGAVLLATGQQQLAGGWRAATKLHVRVASRRPTWQRMRQCAGDRAVCVMSLDAWLRRATGGHPYGWLDVLGMFGDDLRLACRSCSSGEGAQGSPAPAKYHTLKEPRTAPLTSALSPCNPHAAVIAAATHVQSHEEDELVAFSPWPYLGAGAAARWHCGVPLGC